MIRTENNKVINSIVNDFFVQDWFRGQNPIIAGGSILYLYLTFGDENSPASKQVLSKIRSVKKLYSNASIYSNHYHYNPRMNRPWSYDGDIDVWFSSKEDADNALANAAICATPKSSTKWAESFSTKNKLFERISQIQIIKTSPSCPQELFQQFDIANCMIAWQDGNLYIDDRLEQAFDRGIIEYVNNPFKKEKITIASKLFNALRLFKYAERYSLSFSKEINDIILPLYLEVDDVDFSSYEKTVEIVGNTYGIQLASSNRVKSMAQAFAEKALVWYGMDTFKEENLAFLVGLKSPHLHSTVKFVKDALGASDEPGLSRFSNFPF